MNDYSTMGAHGAIFARLVAERGKPRAYFAHGAQYLPSEDDLPHEDLSQYFHGISQLAGLSTMQRALAEEAAEYCASSPELLTIERRDLRQRFMWEAGDELIDHIE